MRPRVTAIVPTLGRSPWLGPCLEALRRGGGSDLEIILVAQGCDVSRERGLADKTLSLAANVGFARANNLGFAEARGEFWATVNDDALVADDWQSTLVATLDNHPRVAAVQGVQLAMDDPRRVDGCGIGWNRWWQAIQIGHGRAADEISPRQALEIFGVSATAALYRGEALQALAPRIFDERLFAYYEDVDLAGRLRARGHRSLLAPRARCRHAGSTTGRRLGAKFWRLLYGNRQLVVARLLGGAFWRAWPRILARDVIDLGKAKLRLDLAKALGVAGGFGRFLRYSGSFVRRGEPAVSLGALRRPGPQDDVFQRQDFEG